MSPGVGLVCFVVKFIRRILAVDHMDGEEVCVLTCGNLDERIRRMRVLTGFDAVIHQVEEDAAEIAGFNLHFFREQKLKGSPDIVLRSGLTFAVENGIDQIVTADGMETLLLEGESQSFKIVGCFLILSVIHQRFICMEIPLHIFLQRKCLLSAAGKSLVLLFLQFLLLVQRKEFGFLTGIFQSIVGD